MVEGKIKLIVFDLDGTLADSKKIYVDAIQLVLSNNGFKFTKGQIMAAMGPKLRATLLNLRKFDDIFLKKLRGEINSIIEVKAPKVKAAPYALQTLKKLKSNPQYKIILMTNSTHRFAHNFLHNSGLEGYFNIILGAEDFLSKETAFHALFNELKVKPNETIYIGDKISDYDRAIKVKCGLALVKAVAWDKGKLNKKPYREYAIADLRKLSNI